MLNKRIYIIIGVLSIFFCVITVSVIISYSNKPFNDDIISGRGEIVFLSFEGGFYGIMADNEKHYDPINLPNEFKIDGLPILFKAKIRRDLGSIHMWGEIIELLFIDYLSLENIYIY